MNEQAKRRHPRQKMRGMRLKLADGQRWHFQAAKPEFALRRIGDQFYPDVHFEFGDHGEEFRLLVEQCGNPDPEKRRDGDRTIMWIARESLRIQYDLKWYEAWELLEPLLHKRGDDYDPLGLLHRSLLLDPMREGVAILDQIIAASRQAEALQVG